MRLTLTLDRQEVLEVEREGGERLVEDGPVKVGVEPAKCSRLES